MIDFGLQSCPIDGSNLSHQADKRGAKANDKTEMAVRTRRYLRTCIWCRVGTNAGNREPTAGL